MYEGAPDWPQKDRFWSIIERYGVTIFYTAPDRHPRVHALGHGVAGRHDLSLAAAARIGRRADQPRSVDLVSPAHRRRALPGRRHVVADRNRHDHDHAAARLHQHQARLGDAAVSRHHRRDPQRAGRAGRRRAAACSRSRKPWPSMLRGIYGDPERYVQQYWTRGPRRLFHRRRRASVDADGYFWLLGRVDDVINVAGHRHRHDGGRERARRSSARGGGRGRRQAARDQGAGDRGVRHAEGRDRRDAPRSIERAEGTRRPQDWRDRAARRDPLHRRSAENAIGQDHAPAAARHRRRQGARRHDDARRSRPLSRN